MNTVVPTVDAEDGLPPLNLCIRIEGMWCPSCAWLIEQVLPDVLVKGGDYRVDQIAGADAVQRNGGEVRVLGFKPGRSTTALITELKKTPR